MYATVREIAVVSLQSSTNKPNIIRKAAALGEHSAIQGWCPSLIKINSVVISIEC
jgi:hypothetical protein